MPARHIIHTVAPKWYLNQPERFDQLTSCYKESLLLAEKHHLHAIAFPCIGMGIYRCPLETGAAIAVSTVRACTQDMAFCCEIKLISADDRRH